ncbi:MAG: hypothetical protein JL50_12615 [Peptococcaceae bacterium BICA1-7]|nr:MAG: hypothetical protein JL50_12615 [Peptococcaceae bacterium BICA1-7]HBV97074.1 hypothetical protein [Desulfotomaculum sp.]
MKIDLNKPIKIDLEKLKQLFRGRSRIILVGLMLALAVGLAVFFIFYKSRENNQPTVPVSPGASEKTPSVLPEIRRSDTAGQPPETAIDQFRDPFAGPMALKGIMRGGAEDMAIIVVGDSAFVAEKGSLVADIWTVTEIDSTSVTLTAGEKKMKLEFGGRSKSETVKSESTQGVQKSENSETENRAEGMVLQGDENSAKIGQ